MRRFLLEHTIYLHVEENREDTPIMSPDLELLSTLIGSNYPCLELIFMVSKVFEPLKFDCIWDDPTTRLAPLAASREVGGVNANTLLASNKSQLTPHGIKSVW